GLPERHIEGVKANCQFALPSRRTSIFPGVGDDDMNSSCGKCPTSFKLVDVFLSRPQPEASTSFKLVGHCAARFFIHSGRRDLHARFLRKIHVVTTLVVTAWRVFIVSGRRNAT